MEDLERIVSIVEDVLQHIRRRRRLPLEEWEDFHGWAWEKLVATDYAAIHKFEGRGSLRGYLAVVLNRYLLDYRTQKWGKWRPSTKATKLGPWGVALELLLHRDGYRLSDAVQTLIVDRGCPLSEDDLHAIAPQLPHRRKDRTSAEDWLDELPTPRPSPADELVAQDTESSRTRIESCLHEAVTALGKEERVALKLKFEQGLKINEIARALGRNPRRFYRQFDRILTKLQRQLRKSGVDAESLEIAFPDAEWGQIP